GEITVNANTLTSLNAHGTTLYRPAGREVRQSDSGHLAEYTQALCRQISGTGIKLYTLTVQPYLLPRVTLPCQAREHAAEITSWSSSSDRSREVSNLATRILESYQSRR